MIGQSPSFSVSEFVAVFNQSLEMIYPQVAIVGELSNFRVSKNKWVYFDLKDEFSSVKFFGTVYMLPGPLEDGLTCEVYGRPRLHNQFGFSVQIDSIRPVGEGSIRKAQDLLYRKMEKEGLFAPERKRPLPYPPSRIGLITSAESAAIADFKKIIKARWPSLSIDLTDTLVQGAQAPAAIAKAVSEFNMLSDPPEMIVLIRGGGSADDLAAFSDEAVVRAVAASRLPTLVAIGHENDTSLAELAADKRASTPSNAAELLVPDINHERELAGRAGAELNKALAGLLADGQSFIADQSRELFRALESRLAHSAQSLASQRLLLRALDPLAPLQQGYALVRNGGGKHVKRASQIRKDEVFSVQFTDEKIQARRTGDE